MNILYIITKLELGGAQKVCLDLARHFNKKNNVYLISSLEGQLNKEAEKLLGENFIKNPYLVRKISPLKDLKAFNFIRKFIENNDIDLVHTHSSKAGVLGRVAAHLNNIDKVIHTIHGFAFNDFKNPLINQIYKNIERYTAHLADYLIAVTNMDIKKGLENNIGKKEQYRLVRAAADVDYFVNYKNEDEKIREKYNIEEDSFIVTQMSCFKKQKNPLDFVKIAKKLKDRVDKKTYFFLVGDGKLGKKIKRKISEFGLEENVILTGWEDDVRPFISVSDVFTLTSLWEGLPIAIIEAHLLKKPVVVTKVDGNQEIVRNGINGFLYTPGNIDNAVEKLEILYHNQDLGKKMGNLGYEKVIEEFSKDKMLKDTEAIYYD
ncbi:MAG: glycosyltransferase family 4 protein [Candidatus Mcinerneyibacterium aminivorans]|uniref:Glycosyltransferase family 4 protein n=1 Tax=Candidatus Mcinerneyibacterium aminivorans TaxID=2703815 RepID=A0A5D0MG83_9BACT|nr:MAG: glycosyltransferase family 4 protein [Candidatus Mcinerneyibacterium aminivorans]